MALIVNSTEIPQSGAVNFNSTALKQVNHGSVLVWTSTPDPITIMSTGKSIGSWLGGGVLGSDAGYQVFSMASQGYKNCTNGNIQAHGGIVDGKLSEAGLYKLLSQMGVGNPNWFAQIATATDAGLLRELVIMQAFQMELTRKNTDLLDRLTVIASLDYLTRMEGTTGREMNDLYTRMVGAQQ